ncbi:thiopurine S-methyltransferase [Roseovarius amoyensis]|uniref:thiopurine S-methyltransferase n=1 Tax=Roseovarius amoyensis TaxID=2211448 RepID=UPI000DBE5F7B|nr:thiopurine S-methyltransferase [Roseovarius amoyensis]
MEQEFWHQRWQDGRVGFHEGRVNPMLAKYLDQLEPAPGARIFLPLCGKTVDLGWLRDQGYRPVGAELSGIAIGELFAELDLTPEVTPAGPLKRHAADGIEVFEGDIFDLTAQVLGPVDAVFDRAALIALPEAMRGDYAAHVTAITGRAPQLMVTFDYDQTAMAGPPFSVTGAEVAALYGADYTIERLDAREVPGGLKGFCPAQAETWLMTARA